MLCESFECGLGPHIYALPAYMRTYVSQFPQAHLAFGPTNISTEQSLACRVMSGQPAGALYIRPATSAQCGPQKFSMDHLSLCNSNSCYIGRRRLASISNRIAQGSETLDIQFPIQTAHWGLQDRSFPGSGMSLQATSDSRPSGMNEQKFVSDALPRRPLFL